MTIQREDILTCACDLYLTEGLGGFTMRKLAEEVGVTAPALYRHYDSRDAVLAEIVGEAYRLLAEYLYRTLEASTPEERFRRAGFAYLDFALEQPRLYEMLYASAEVLGMEKMPEETAARASAVGQFWMDRVRDCMDAGVLREGDPEAVATTMWAHCHGLISIYLRGMLRMEEEEIRALYGASCRRVLRGVATERYPGMAGDDEGSVPAGPPPPVELASAVTSEAKPDGGAARSEPGAVDGGEEEPDAVATGGRANPTNTDGDG